jgi:hypothetical protein
MSATSSHGQGASYRLRGSSPAGAHGAGQGFALSARGHVLQPGGWHVGCWAVWARGMALFWRASAKLQVWPLRIKPRCLVAASALPGTTCQSLLWEQPLACWAAAMQQRRDFGDTAPSHLTCAGAAPVPGLSCRHIDPRPSFTMLPAMPCLNHPPQDVPPAPQGAREGAGGGGGQQAG